MATIRHPVIGAALRRWKRMCSDDEEEVRPIHRPRDWKRKDRKLAKPRLERSLSGTNSNKARHQLPPFWTQFPEIYWKV